MLASALHLNPTAAGLWSYAASWEFQHNANPGGARVLMQRGLRMVEGRAAVPLWLEYFRMELLYAAKLRARRAVLGIEPAAGMATGGTGVCSI